MADPRATSFFRPVQQGFLTFVLALAFVAACWGLYQTRWIMLALAIGLGLGVILTPVMGWLNRRARIPMPVCVILVLVAILAILLGGGYVVADLLGSQVQSLSREMPELIRKVQGTLSGVLAHYPWLQRRIGSIQFPQGEFAGAAKAALSAIETSFAVLGGAVFVLVVAMYYSVNPELYLRGVLSGVPEHARPRAGQLLCEIGSSVRRWFYSQLVAMIIMGAIACIGLRIIGSQYWLLLGFLTAALELIPFFGPIAAFFIGSLVTLGSQPDKFWWVVAYYAASLRVEGDIVIPLVMKGRIRLPPIQLLVLLLILGEWFGVLGFFVATPALAVARTIYLLAWVPRMDRKARPTYVEPAVMPGKGA